MIPELLVTLLLMSLLIFRRKLMIRLEILHFLASRLLRRIMLSIDYVS